MAEGERNAAALLSPSGSLQPASSATTAQGVQAQASAQPVSESPHHKKRKGKARRAKNNSLQVDGAVSDSVVTSMPSAQPRQSQKQMQHSVALPARPAQSAVQDAQKQRPVSVGSNMLPGTPLKEQAYAGPTFQASPAASALPMPKFFSKSVPNVGKHSASLDARMTGQKTPENESSPEPDVVSPQPPSRSAQQSPLDLFFDAQKAENRRKASAQLPEMKAHQQPPATEPRNLFQHSGKNVFLRELDGDGDAMPSPKTVPPNRYDRDAYTQSLKDLLFKGKDSTAVQHSTPLPTQRSTSNVQSPEQQYLTPSPTQRSTSGPSTPTPNAEQQNHYSLHYGNRNLSPLFKAARGDTPPRPSNLRQHSSASDCSPTNGQPQSPTIDPNSFSRSYLDQHIRASQRSTMPHLVGMNGAQQQSNHSSPPPSQHGVPASGNGASPRASSNGSRDITSMEDELRRMLNVNVLGN